MWPLEFWELVASNMIVILMTLELSSMLLGLSITPLENIYSIGRGREYLRGKYHCSIELLFDWFGLACFINKNKNCQLSYSWLQTSQTGGQQYSDTSHFSIPWYWCHSWQSSFTMIILFYYKPQVSSCKLTLVHARTWGSVNHQMAEPVPSISCCVLNYHNLFYQIQNALAFNQDTCCHLALSLRLLPFHCCSLFTPPWLRTGFRVPKT